jgi:hypothetical protein
MGIQKAIAAVVLSVLMLIEIGTGWQSGVTEEWILATLAILSPILVYVIPNR